MVCAMPNKKTNERNCLHFIFRVRAMREKLLLSHLKCGTAINCIEVRFHLPVIRWMKDALQLDFVDILSEPGVVKILSNGTETEIECIRSKTCGSIESHGSDIIAVVGHDNCSANPASHQEQLRQIKKAKQVVRDWNLPVEVVGLWVGKNYQVENVDF